MKSLKSYVAAIVAVASVVGFSAFNIAEDGNNKLADVTVYFHGNPASATEVEDLSKWNDQPNGQSCNTGTINACAISVDDSNLTPSPDDPNIRLLDPADIEITAVETTTDHFVPDDQNSPSPFDAQSRL